MIVVILCAVASLYLIAASFMVTTGTWRAALMFQVIPFLIGMLLAFVAARDAGFVITIVS